MFLDLHPLVIHFPIALFSSAILFDLISIIYKKNELLITSWWVMFLAIICSLLAMITGFVDDKLIGHFSDISPFWLNHSWMQIISIIGFISLFSWRSKSPNLFYSNKLFLLYLILGIINVGILFYGSHLGAQLAGRV